MSGFLLLNWSHHLQPALLLGFLLVPFLSKKFYLCTIAFMIQHDIKSFAIFFRTNVEKGHQHVLVTSKAELKSIRTVTKFFDHYKL